MPRRNDFMEGLLQGLYNAGVGNPAVNDARQQADNEYRLKQAQLGIEASKEGMVPAGGDQHPVMDHPGFLSGLRSVLFPSSVPTLNTSFVQDPNAPTYGQNPEGEFALGTKDKPLEPTYVKVPRDKGIAGLASQNKPEKKANKYHFVDSSTRQMYDQNMNPIFMAPPGSIPKIISNPYAGSEYARRDALAVGALNSVQTAKDLMTSDTLTELKGIKFTPGKMYSQFASSDAKELYRNLYNAIANQLYLKTGATANPNEIENNMIMYMPAANDTVGDMQKRLDMLGTEASLYSAPKPGAKNPSPSTPLSPKTKSLSPEDQQAIDWAKKNPLDPRAIQIKKLHGI